MPFSATSDDLHNKIYCQIAGPQVAVRKSRRRQRARTLTWRSKSSRLTLTRLFHYAFRLQLFSMFLLSFYLSAQKYSYSASKNMRQEGKPKATKTRCGAKTCPEIYKHLCGMQSNKLVLISRSSEAWSNRRFALHLFRIIAQTRMTNIQTPRAHMHPWCVIVFRLRTEQRCSSDRRHPHEERRSGREWREKRNERKQFSCGRWFLFYVAFSTSLRSPEPHNCFFSEQVINTRRLLPRHSPIKFTYVSVSCRSCFTKLLSARLRFASLAHRAVVIGPFYALSWSKEERSKQRRPPNNKNLG